MFVLQNAPAADAGAARADAARLESSDTGTAKFDLTLRAHRDAATGWTGRCEYSTDLFDAGHDRADGGAPARCCWRPPWPGPSSASSELPLLTDAGARSRCWWSGTTRPRDLPAERLRSPPLRGAGARARPDARGGRLRGRSASPTRELDARANQLAHHLRALGVRPEVRVGAVRGALAGAGGRLLGILKAGGAYVPLDPALPARAPGASCCEDAAAPVLRHPASAWPTSCPRQRARWCCLDAERPRIAAPARAQPPTRGAGAGQPGLRHLHLRLHGPAQGRRCSQHRGAVQPRRWRRRASRLRPGQPRAAVRRLSASTPPCAEVFAALLRGRARWCWPRASTLLPGAPLRDAAARGRPSPPCTPDALACWRSWQPRGAARAAHGHLRAARRCPPELVRALGAAGAHVHQRLRPHRGHRRAPRSPSARRTRSGADHRPAAGQRARCTCWTRALQPGARGRAGRAVHRRRRAWRAATWAGPELTAERFVPDPFGAEPGRAAVPHGRPGALAARTARSSSWAASTSR